MISWVSVLSASRRLRAWGGGRCTRSENIATASSRIALWVRGRRGRRALGQSGSEKVPPRGLGMRPHAGHVVCVSSDSSARLPRRLGPTTRWPTHASTDLVSVPRRVSRNCPTYGRSRPRREDVVWAPGTVQYSFDEGTVKSRAGYLSQLVDAKSLWIPHTTLPGTGVYLLSPPLDLRRHCSNTHLGCALIFVVQPCFVWRPCDVGCLVASAFNGGVGPIGGDICPTLCRRVYKNPVI